MKIKTKIKGYKIVLNKKDYIELSNIFWVLDTNSKIDISILSNEQLDILEKFLTLLIEGSEK